MIEKNRDILSNALKNMPTRSPKTSSWDHISDHLNELEATNFISSHRDNLPQHKAPEDAWLAISNSLSSSFSAFLKSGNAKLISALIILAGLTAVYLLYTPPSNDKITDQRQDSNLIESYKDSETIEDNQRSEIIEAVAVSDIDKTTLNSSAEEGKQPENIMQNTHKYSEAGKLTGNNTSQEMRVQHASIIDRENIGTSQINSGNALTRLTPKSPPQILISAENTERSLLAETPALLSDNDNFYVEDFSSPKFSVGLYYSYNQIQKVEYEGMTIPHHLSSFGFEVEYEKQDWFLKIGLGYLNWNEEGNYIIDYDQNQMIYSYHYVDSAIVNPANGDINYYTSGVEVFDSISQQKNDQATYNYQSLQIPFLIGYKFIDRSGFNVALLGGVAFDFKISGKQYVPELNEENASVTGINNSIIYRTTTNWRFIIGLNIDYNITKRWGLYAEPTYQQYMTPIYSTNSIKAGGMLNIKVGIKYSF